MVETLADVPLAHRCSVSNDAGGPIMRSGVTRTVVLAVGLLAFADAKAQINAGVGGEEPIEEPFAPTDLKAIPNENADCIDLRWFHPKDDATIEVKWKPPNSSSFQTVASLAPGTQKFTHCPTTPSLQRGKKYEYWVWALYPSGALGSNITWSTPVYSGFPLADWLVPCYLCPAGAEAQTQLVQEAFNTVKDVPEPTAPKVIYFRNGIYDINQTVFIEGGHSYEVIGQTPGGVVFRWVGEPGHTPANAKPILHVDGSSRLTLRNIVFDGGVGENDEHRYVVGLDVASCRGLTYNHACDGLHNPYHTLSPTSGQANAGLNIVDSTFKNTWVGMRIGHYRTQDSEITVRRSQFIANDFGVSIEFGQSYNEWFWDCSFERNRYAAITNMLGLQVDNYSRDDGDGHGNVPFQDGDFRVIRGRFIDTCNMTSSPACAQQEEGIPDKVGADITIVPTGWPTVRESWSKGSPRFLVSTLSPEPTFRMQSTPISLIKNELDVLPGGTSNRGAIDIETPGPLFLQGNRIDTTDANNSPIIPAVSATATEVADVLGVENAFSAGSATYVGAYKRVNSIGDNADAAPFSSTPPQVPQSEDPRDGRIVYTVTDGNNAQDVIDAALSDSREALVYFPSSGGYNISQSLIIPSPGLIIPQGKDLIVAGNGIHSHLYWVGSAAGPIFKVSGYNVNGLTIRDLYLDGTDENPDADPPVVGIRIDGANQVNSRVYVNRLLVAREEGTYAQTGIDVAGCDRTKVDVVDLYSSGVVETSRHPSKMLVSGSRVARRGHNRTQGSRYGRA